MTRILDRYGPDLAALRGPALLDAIREAEGRTVLAEVIASAPPLLTGTANAELVAAFGADLICCNLVDPAAEGVLVTGLEELDPPPAGFGGLARLLGRPVGCNLEPDLPSVPRAVRGTASAGRAAVSNGAAFVIVTANPGRGAGLADLVRTVRTLTEAEPGLVVLAGKMHQAGAEETIGPHTAEALVAAGADGVLVPVPGTVPGVSETTARETVVAARAAGAVAVSTIGTSQEGADLTTIRTLALTAKRIGADVHHIGDAGWTGVASPDVIHAYSVAIRGVRHTWNRMARGTRASWRGAP
ncbi:MAG: hypothetical protein WEB03_11415 [Nitriliruptor sp.]|uniref:DUF7916 family protein n=1 Tax=Nitriliruptor sp. TaxID=2448056 RepID=UPI00349FEE2C